MVSRNKDERAYVNTLIKAIQKNSPGVYVHIDRDAGAVRHTSSGWDFLLAYDGRVVFCEAKVEKGKLSDWQEYARVLIRDMARTPYFVVRFWDEGKHFTIAGRIDEKVETEHARIENFIS